MYFTRSLEMCFGVWHKSCKLQGTVGPPLIRLGIGLFIRDLGNVNIFLLKKATAIKVYLVQLLVGVFLINVSSM